MAVREAQQPLREPISGTGDQRRVGPLDLPLAGGRQPPHTPTPCLRPAEGCHAAAIFSISQPGCSTLLTTTAGLSSAGGKAVCTISGR